MIEIKTMNCGTRVVMEEIPYVNSVAIGIWVRAGAVDETPRTAGISHFIEHMMFKGTELRSAKKLAEEVHAMICEMVFRDHPLGNSITGTHSSLKAMTRNTLKKYIKEEYTRDN